MLIAGVTTVSKATTGRLQRGHQGGSTRSPCMISRPLLMLLLLFVLFVERLSRTAALFKLFRFATPPLELESWL